MDPCLATIEDLLTGIKNVLTMPGVHFLIVAGPDRTIVPSATPRAATASTRASSAGGCTCPASGTRRTVSSPTSSTPVHPPTPARSLAGPVPAVQGQGVPRRLLQEVNSFIAWEENCPRLRIGAADIDRVEFYARLERILDDYFTASQQKRLFPVAIDEDRWRLAAITSSTGCCKATASLRCRRSVPGGRGGGVRPAAAHLPPERRSPPRSPRRERGSEGRAGNERNGHGHRRHSQVRAKVFRLADEIRQSAVRLRGAARGGAGGPGRFAGPADAWPARTRIWRSRPPR